MKFSDFCTSLENKIKDSYENGVTLEEAERLAGEFLYAMMQVSSELKRADLDSRMKKSGVKAIRAITYLDAASKGDKKPTEAALAATIENNSLVSKEQDAFDTAEVNVEDLNRLYHIFKEAHIHFRGIAKGKFD